MFTLSQEGWTLLGMLLLGSSERTPVKLEVDVNENKEEVEEEAETGEKSREGGEDEEDAAGVAPALRRGEGTKLFGEEFSV